ncbi:MAG: hypothetical protein KDB88_06370 [Flavobacteriales bacterium]|nr:hypothetical protein [Flavobacteriales bacterium]
MKHFTTSLVLFALAGIGLLYVKMNDLEKRSQQVDELPPGVAQEHMEEEVELAVMMGRLHHFAMKLHAAGSANDLELARFYHHEMHEVFEGLEDGRIMDEGKDISALVAQYGRPSLDAMGAHLQEEDSAGFSAMYDGLLQSCNACHAASDHAFIRVVAPVRVPNGQVFGSHR